MCTFKMCPPIKKSFSAYASWWRWDRNLKSFIFLMEQCDSHEQFTCYRKSDHFTWLPFAAASFHLALAVESVQDKKRWALESTYVGQWLIWLLSLWLCASHFLSKELPLLSVEHEQYLASSSVASFGSSMTRVLSASTRDFHVGWSSAFSHSVITSRRQSLGSSYFASMDLRVGIFTFSSTPMSNHFVRTSWSSFRTVLKSKSILPLKRKRKINCTVFY